MEKIEERVKIDKYLSYKEYKNYCEENKLEIDEEELNKINEEFIERKLIEYKDYFNNMFTDVGEKINLDEEQRRVILRDEEYCLINAGAGSGKSTIMAGKVKYLVDKLNVKPEEIIMLTFTKKSSEDLDEKVNDLLDLGVPVSTFHSLGMKFIKKCYPFPVKVVGPDEQKSIISNYIKEEMKRQNDVNEYDIYFNDFQDETQLLFKEISKDQKFFINDDGNIVICFDKYEIAPGATGSPEFVIPNDVVKDILK